VTVIEAPPQLTWPYSRTPALLGQVPDGPEHEHALQLAEAAMLVPPFTSGSRVGQPGSLQLGIFEPVSSAIGPFHPVGTVTHVSVLAQPPLDELVELLVLDELVAPPVPLLDELVLDPLLLVLDEPPIPPPLVLDELPSPPPAPPVPACSPLRPEMT
jgi:hypothetical protein